MRPVGMLESTCPHRSEPNSVQSRGNPEVLSLVGLREAGSGFAGGVMHAEAGREDF